MSRRWTDQRPLIDGYYWHRDSPDGTPIILYVEPSQACDLTKLLRDCGYEFPWFAGQWSGPIEPPDPGTGPGPENTTEIEAKEHASMNIKYLSLDGLIDDLPYERYRAEPGLAKSDLDRLAGLAPPKDGAALDLGRLVHAMVLEPHTIEQHFFRGPCGVRKDKRTTAWQEVLAAAGDRALIDWEDWQTAQDMCDSVMSHSTAVELLTGGVAERSAFSYDPTNIGVRIKCRPDYVKEDLGCLVDLKTTIASSPPGFARSCAEYRYHVQAAWYLKVYNLASVPGTVRDFVFIAVEKHPPHYVFTMEVCREDIELAQREIEADLDLYHNRQLIHQLKLPAWYRIRKENSLV